MTLEGGLLMKATLKRLLSLLITVTFIISSSSVLMADQGDFEYITEHVELTVPQKLNITKPAEDITTSSRYYYIMGTSDPAYPLYLANYEITDRGKFGSFGVYVELAHGRNLVRFSNGDDMVEFYITRSDTASSITTTDTISNMFPASDSADFYLNKVDLTCTAPSGAVVTAKVKSRTVELKQAAATAVAGVPATFRGEYTMPDADGVVSLGPVTYTMTYNGKTVTKQSTGELITVGEGNDLVVECTQVSAAVMETPGGNYISTAKLGAKERVVAAEGNYYQLAMGGWISKPNFNVLMGKPDHLNVIDHISFIQDGDAEIYVFHGTENAFVHSWLTEDALNLIMFNTSGLGDFSTEHSSLFSSAVATPNIDGSTTLKLEFSPEAKFWGHTIQYDNGDISLICQYRPTLTGNPDLPLEGIVVALDSGHGALDPGALGTAQLTGPTEAQINRATAIAVKKQLESMGATVHLPEILESNNNFNERMQPAIDTRADVFISLHCNATAANYNSSLAKGVEVYYYESIGKPLAESLLTSITEHTGRDARFVKPYGFRVALNSLAPSVLVEMGYMTNPIDYDDLCSKQGIYNMSVAIGDALVDLLSE